MVTLQMHGILSHAVHSLNLLGESGPLDVVGEN